MYLIKPLEPLEGVDAAGSARERAGLRPMLWLPTLQSTGRARIKPTPNNP